ncbi:MAG: O-antigen/teichoic acid export membrane protein [Glaciecola sp.]
MIQNKRSDFFRNVLILFSGSFLSQLIPFIVLPILQRYYFSPADFGLLAVFVYFSELFAKVATLKLEFGIVIEKTIKNAINLMYGALRISWVMVLISLIVVLFFRYDITYYFEAPKLANYLFLLPIYILVTSFSDVLNYWFNRGKQFEVISYSKIIQRSSAEGVKLLTGALSFSFVGLIIGRIVGFTVVSLYCFKKFWQYDRSSLRLLNRKHSNKMIKKNRKFIFYTTPSVFIGSLINLVYINLFLMYFGKDIVGMIGVSMTYLSAGFGVISVSFSQVFYSKLAEVKDKVIMLAMYKRFARNLFALALVPIICVYVTPSTWVVKVLGEKWVDLMEIARIMVWWLAIWFVSSSLSFIYIRLGRQKEMVLFDLLHLILIFISFFVAIWIKNDFISALWGFTIGQSLYYLFAIYIAIFYIKKFDEIKKNEQTMKLIQRNDSFI